jgi:ribonuclease E
MVHRIAGTAAVFVSLFAAPLIAQEPTCDDIVFDNAAMTVYPQVADACLGVVSAEGGNRYVVMKAKVAQTANVNTVTLSFQHQDGSWGDPRQVTVTDDFRVMVGGEPKHVRDLVMGEQVNLFVREGRWTVVMTDLEVMEVPVEYEAVVEDVGAAELMAVEEAVVEEAVVEDAVAEEAVGDEPVAVAEEPVAEEPPPAEEQPAQEVPASGGVNWFWIGVLAVAIVIVFVFISRRKKKEA